VVRVKQATQATKEKKAKEVGKMRVRAKQQMGMSPSLRFSRMRSNPLCRDGRGSALKGRRE
jgi:hypothetical protein